MLKNYHLLVYLPTEFWCTLAGFVNIPQILTVLNPCPAFPQCGIYVGFPFSRGWRALLPPTFPPRFAATENSVTHIDIIYGLDSDFRPANQDLCHCRHRCRRLLSSSSLSSHRGFILILGAKSFGHCVLARNLCGER